MLEALHELPRLLEATPIESKPQRKSTVPPVACSVDHPDRGLLIDLVVAEVELAEVRILRHECDQNLLAPICDASLEEEHLVDFLDLRVSNNLEQIADPVADTVHAQVDVERPARIMTS